MGLELRDADLLPPSSLAPIKTTSGTATEVPDEIPAAESSATGNEEAEEECVTPKSMTLPPALVCPPAPRKPQPAKRKRGPPPKGYYLVPRDLRAVFVPLSRSCPSSKRIRVR